MLTNQIIILIILLVFSGIFSGIETALISISMIKVNSLVKQKKAGSEALHRLKQDPHKLIITILIGNNLVNIGAASLATIIFTDMFGSKGIGISTGIMTLLILIFGEITPKTLAAQNAGKISLLVSRPIEILYFVLSPLVFIFGLISRTISSLLGSKEKKQLSEEELRTIVTMGVKEGILNREAAEMMHNVLDFEETKVTDIMTPKASIEKIKEGRIIIKCKYVKRLGMQTKLTLRLESELIEQAKEHAKQQGKSLSQIVADYFLILLMRKNLTTKLSCLCIQKQKRAKCLL